LGNDELSQLFAIPIRQSRPFRTISIGRLLHWKGFELGIRAFAKFCIDNPESEYWLIGDGPERKRLERLTGELGIEEKVVFWGHLPRENVLERLSKCDVLMFPSLHDSGGWVCLEAMAAGRPVICLDLGGPGLQVTHQTGIKASAGSPAQAISGLSAALEVLASDLPLRIRLGEAGRNRVCQDFSWEKKAEALAAVCEQLTITNPGDTKSVRRLDFRQNVHPKEMEAGIRDDLRRFN